MSDLKNEFAIFRIGLSSEILNFLRNNDYFYWFTIYFNHFSENVHLKYFFKLVINYILKKFSEIKA